MLLAQKNFRTNFSLEHCLSMRLTSLMHSFHTFRHPNAFTFDWNLISAVEIFDLCWEKLCHFIFNTLVQWLNRMVEERKWIFSIFYSVDQLNAIDTPPSEWSFHDELLLRRSCRHQKTNSDWMLTFSFEFNA